MGATISVDKRAVAMRAADGKIYYFLFESTYQKKDGGSPSWGCVHFGDAQSCMSVIIRFSMSCEGGMLKERNGDTTASAYIKHWREALANPVEFCQPAMEFVTMQYGKIYCNTDEEKARMIETSKAVAARLGLAFDDAGKLSMNLMSQAADIQTMMEEGFISAWRTFDNVSMNGQHNPHLGYVVPPFSVKGPTFKVAYIPEANRAQDECEHFVFLPDGKELGTGWKYSTVQMMIDLFAIDSERLYPGSAESCIRAIRSQIVKCAEVLPENSRVWISRHQLKTKWQQEYFKQIQKALSIGESVGVIETTIAALRLGNALRPVAMLASVGKISAVSFKPADEMNQLSLVA